jgi:DNA polymerase (family 10)
MTNQQIARILNETAAMLDLTGENPFRSRAYRNAARVIERLEERAAELLARGTLTEVPGIGAGLEAQIRALVETGSFALRDELRASVPPGLGQLLRIKGLGVQKARVLWQELGITNIDALEAAAASGRLTGVPGFGKRMQDKIVASVELFRTYDARRRYAGTVLNTEPILQRLRQSGAVRQAEHAGELRRRLETVGRVDLIAAATDLAAVEAAFADWRTEAPAEPADGGTRLSGALADGFPVALLVVPPAAFGTAWWRATGSAAHVAAFERRYGAPPALADEAGVYAWAGLPFVEPELREGTGELEAAAAGALPALLTTRDLRGTLHNHSTYSDGANTLREMAEAARTMGLSYFGICDHSQSLTIARGLSVDEVRRQQEEIRALNHAFAAEGGKPFRILSGIECDILADGALDYPDDVLATFDFVVASVHSGFEMTEAAATERLIRAVENPYTTILGHATGRLLLAREGYRIDHEAVIAACAAAGVAIELNANPYRLDMDWRWLRRAAGQGVYVAINPDAHAVDELHNVRWGVAVARKAWLTADQCLNALPLDAFLGWLETRRPQRVS